MGKQSRSSIKAISHIRQSIDDASALQYIALTKMESELVTPGNSPIKNKGKSPPLLRSPGSSLGPNRIGNSVACKENRFHYEIEFYQKKQYQFFTTI